MTVSSTTARADYNGNGVTTAFAVPFYFLDNTHLQIIRTQISTGVATTLALTTDYTIAGAGVEAGGTATMLVAPTADQRLSILRNIPLTQLAQYVPNDPFPSATHQRIVDQLTMVTQQLNETIGRALVLSANSSGVSGALPSPTATNLLGWNSGATALQNYDAGSLGVAISYAAWIPKTFSGDAVTTAFVLDTDAGTAANCDVSVGGVSQVAGINFTYTASTKTITFLTGAPPAGTNNVYVRYGMALPQGVIVSSNISDATATGISVLTAANAAAARTAISAAETGANSTITSLTALASVPTVVSNSWGPGTRQTVRSGPVDTSGLPSFGGSTGSTTVTASGTLYPSAANGILDRNGSITNPSWTGLSTNGTMYLYLDIAADGTCTTGSTTVQPTYRSGGADVVTTNQFTFNTMEMVGKVGNGSVATQTYRVFVGEVTVAGAVVTAITWYALNGRYNSPETATLPSIASSKISVNHNIGITGCVGRWIIRCTTAQNGFAVGEERDNVGSRDSGQVSQAVTPTVTRLTTYISTTDNVQYQGTPAAGGASVTFTSANWAYRFEVRRPW